MIRPVTTPRKASNVPIAASAFRLTMPVLGYTRAGKVDATTHRVGRGFFERIRGTIPPLDRGLAFDPIQFPILNDRREKDSYRNKGSWDEYPEGRPRVEGSEEGAKKEGAEDKCALITCVNVRSESPYVCERRVCPLVFLLLPPPDIKRTNFAPGPRRVDSSHDLLRSF